MSVVSLEFYREKARDCENRAKKAVEDQERSKWVSIAAQWHRLALEVEERRFRHFGILREEARGRPLHDWHEAEAPSATKVRV